MNKAVIAEFDEVLARVAKWDAEVRIELAHRLLHGTSGPAQSLDAARRASAVAVMKTMQERYPSIVSADDDRQVGSRVESLIGIGAGNGPPPTDVQIKQWIEERRWAKTSR